jgi:hypothetical protein
MTLPPPSTLSAESKVFLVTMNIAPPLIGGSSSKLVNLKPATYYQVDLIRCQVYLIESVLPDKRVCSSGIR